jgi:hypothetical protein
MRLSSPSDHVAQATFPRHLFRAFPRRIEPVFKVFDPDLLFDFCLLDADYNARGNAVRFIRPFMLPEEAQRLSYRLVKALCGNRDCVLDAPRILACDFAVLACDFAVSDRHSADDITFAFSSLMD